MRIGGALAELSRRCAEFAREARADLDARGLREIDSGALGMCGTRPAGVYSCLQTLGLVGVCGRAPGHRAVVWGTHDLALRTALCLLDAGVSVECVLETREAPQGAAALVRLPHFVACSSSRMLGMAHMRGPRRAMMSPAPRTQASAPRESARSEGATRPMGSAQAMMVP